MDDPYRIGFVAEEVPDVRALYQRCRQVGVKTTHDGESGVVAKYRTGLTAHTDSSLKSALDALEEVDTGSMYFWTDSGLMLRVGFTHPTSEEEQKLGCVSIGFQTSEIDRGGRPDSMCRARINELLNLVAELVPVVDPKYVWSTVYKGPGGYERFVPDSEPSPDNIDNLSWITVMSEQVVRAFGGRKHVLDTPAWQIRELDSGHIMLVLTDYPIKPMEPKYSPSEEHLLQR